MAQNEAVQTIEQKPIFIKAQAVRETSKKANRPKLSTAYVAGRNQLEQTIAEIWQKILGIEPVGIHDDFYELGGDSLVAVRIVSRVREAFGVDLRLSCFLESHTVAGVAQAIAKR